LRFEAEPERAARLDDPIARVEGPHDAMR
jgi:hypothetical protein